MPVVYTHIKPFEKRAINYFQLRLYEIGKEMDTLKDERDFLTEMVRKLNPCPACKGAGEFREVVEQDHSECYGCMTCGGTGIKKD